MEHPAKINVKFGQCLYLGDEICFRVAASLRTGIFHWQEFADLPFQELMDRTQALNSPPDAMETD